MHSTTMLKVIADARADSLRGAARRRTRLTLRRR